jgi:hypothetical protein
VKKDEGQPSPREKNQLPDSVAERSPKDKAPRLAGGVLPKDRILAPSQKSSSGEGGDPNGGGAAVEIDGPEDGKWSRPHFENRIRTEKRDPEVTVHPERHPREYVPYGDPVPWTVPIGIQRIENVDGSGGEVVAVVRPSQDLARIESHGPLEGGAGLLGRKNQKRAARLEIDQKAASVSPDRHVPGILESGDSKGEVARTRIKPIEGSSLLGQKEEPSGPCRQGDPALRKGSGEKWRRRLLDAPGQAERQDFDKEAKPEQREFCGHGP